MACPPHPACLGDTWHALLTHTLLALVTRGRYIFRRAPFAWIIQDSLSVDGRPSNSTRFTSASAPLLTSRGFDPPLAQVAVCIIFVRTLRLPSLKLAALLLGMMFTYDIFMVFVSPNADLLLPPLTSSDLL